MGIYTKSQAKRIDIALQGMIRKRSEIDTAMEQLRDPAAIKKFTILYIARYTQDLPRSKERKGIRDAISTMRARMTALSYAPEPGVGMGDHGCPTLSGWQLNIWKSELDSRMEESVNWRKSHVALRKEVRNMLARPAPRR